MKFYAFILALMSILPLSHAQAEGICVKIKILQDSNDTVISQPNDFRIFSIDPGNELLSNQVSIENTAPPGEPADNHLALQAEQKLTSAEDPCSLTSRAFHFYKDGPSFDQVTLLASFPRTRADAKAHGCTEKFVGASNTLVSSKGFSNFTQQGTHLLKPYYAYRTIEMTIGKCSR